MTRMAISPRLATRTLVNMPARTLPAASSSSPPTAAGLYSRVAWRLGRQGLRATPDGWLWPRRPPSSCLVAPAQASVPAGNLLANPGAEAGPGAPDASTINAPPGWTTTGELTAVKYGASGFPTSAVSSQIDGGANFFAAGNVATSTGEQLLNVSAAQPEIDAGGVSAALSACLGGFSSQEDNARITTTFLGASGATLGSFEIGPVTAGRPRQPDHAHSPQRQRGRPRLHALDQGGDHRDQAVGALQRRLRRQRQPESRRVRRLGPRRLLLPGRALPSGGGQVGQRAPASGKVFVERAGGVGVRQPGRRRDQGPAVRAADLGAPVAGRLRSWTPAGAR